MEILYQNCLDFRAFSRPPSALADSGLWFVFACIPSPPVGRTGLYSVGLRLRLRPLGMGRADSFKIWVWAKFGLSDIGNFRHILKIFQKSKKRTLGSTWPHPAPDLLVSQLIELIFSYITQVAFPVIWQVLEGGARFYARFRVSLFWIVDIGAIDANVFFHVLAQVPLNALLDGEIFCLGMVHDDGGCGLFWIHLVLVGEVHAYVFGVQ